MSQAEQTILVTAIEEARLAETQDTILCTSTPNSGYRQQLSNMDIIFNFFLWCKAAGVTKKRTTKPKHLPLPAGADHSG